MLVSLSRVSRYNKDEVTQAGRSWWRQQKMSFFLLWKLVAQLFTILSIIVCNTACWSRSSVLTLWRCCKILTKYFAKSSAKYFCNSIQIFANICDIFCQFIFSAASQQSQSTTISNICNTTVTYSSTGVVDETMIFVIRKLKKESK